MLRVILIVLRKLIIDAHDFDNVSDAVVIENAPADRRRHRARYIEKIRAPIAEREHKAQPHRQPEPLHTQAIGMGASHACPRMGVTRGQRMG